MQERNCLYQATNTEKTGLVPVHSGMLYYKFPNVQAYSAQEIEEKCETFQTLYKQVSTYNITS